MLEIYSIDQFRNHVLHKEEIRESNIGNNSICFCYMFSAENTFDSNWTREARGIVFDEFTGFVISRPLHKFFNINERGETQVQHISWDKVIRVMDKRDGCCDAGTILNTADGLMTIKEICDNKYLGLVLGWNHILNEVQWTPILGHNIQQNNNDWYELELENGTKIKLTGNHLVWCINRSEYVRVDQLTINDEIKELF